MRELLAPSHEPNAAGARSLTVIEIAVPGYSLENGPARDLFDDRWFGTESERLEVGKLKRRDAALANEAVQVVEYSQVLRRAGEMQRR